MSTYPPVRDELARLLSSPRLGPYRQAVGGELDDALRLYSWNLEVSAAFFESIHYLEVALRNTMDEALRHWSIDTLAVTEPWYRTPAVPLNPRTRRVIATAVSQATDGGRPELPGRVVAELSSASGGRCSPTGTTGSCGNPGCGTSSRPPVGRASTTRSTTCACFATASRTTNPTTHETYEPSSH